MKVLRLRTLIVGNFQDHLVLVGGLLDEIDVVLRVRLVQKIENPRLGDTVGLGLFAEDVDSQIRGMVEQVGVDKEEPRELEHFAHQGSRAGIDLVRIDSGNGISKLALQLRRGSGANLQHGLGLEKCQQTGDFGVQLSHQQSSYDLNGRTLIRSLQKREHQALVGGEK